MLLQLFSFLCNTFGRITLKNQDKNNEKLTLILLPLAKIANMKNILVPDSHVWLAVHYLELRWLSEGPPELLTAKLTGSSLVLIAIVTNEGRNK